MNEAIAIPSVPTTAKQFKTARSAQNAVKKASSSYWAVASFTASVAAEHADDAVATLRDAWDNLRATVTTAREQGHEIKTDEFDAAEQHASIALAAHDGKAKVSQTLFESVITYTMSGVIPLFTMVCARQAGAMFAEGNLILAIVASVLALTSLAVSLSHLARAISLITKTHIVASFALAVAFDGGIVLSELLHAFGDPRNVIMHALAWAMLGCLTGLSGVLNWYAFTRH